MILFGKLLDVLKDDIYIVVHSNDFDPLEFVDGSVKEIKTDKNILNYKVSDIECYYDTLNIRIIR